MKKMKTNESEMGFGVKFASKFEFNIFVFWNGPKIVFWLITKQSFGSEDLNNDFGNFTGIVFELVFWIAIKCFYGLG